MANVNVTYQEMQDAAARLKHGQDSLDQILMDLSNLINGLIASGFQTEFASGAFGDTYDKFTNGTKQAISGLEGLSNFLTSAANAMQETDTQLARAISSNG
jgi:WXG100 family type VII secretion target